MSEMKIISENGGYSAVIFTSAGKRIATYNITDAVRELLDNKQAELQEVHNKHITEMADIVERYAMIQAIVLPGTGPTG